MTSLRLWDVVFDEEDEIVDVETIALSKVDGQLYPIYCSADEAIHTRRRAV